MSALGREWSRDVQSSLSASCHSRLLDPLDHSHQKGSPIFDFADYPLTRRNRIQGVDVGGFRSEAALVQIEC